MLASIKNLSNQKILQFFFIADSILIHTQTYWTADYKFLVVGLTLACIHIVLLGMEHICQIKSQSIILMISILKGILQTVVGYTIIPDQLLFTGIQISLIVKQNDKNLKLITFLFFLTSIPCISVGSVNKISLGLLRAVVNYYLLCNIFKSNPSQNMIYMKKVLLLIQHEEFCLLNLKYEPIFETSLFQKLLQEQVISTSENNCSRIFTPRDMTTQIIKQSNQLDNITTRPTLSVGDIIDQLKKKMLKLNQKLVYEPSNHDNYYLSVQKVVFDDDENFIMITKHKYSNQDSPQEKPKSDDQIQMMIKTLHKVSHDMRNPLNAIINMQVCLQDQINPTLAQKFLKPSLNSCHLLLNLINDILDAAQINNKSVKIIIKKFNLAKLIDKTISLFDSLKEKKELQITFNYDPKLNFKINSDKLRIRQIIMNLLSNAIKYTQPKGAIFIECSLNTEKQNSINISVQDSGMGIKPENLSLLFKEFGKIDDDENKKMNPVGIGLGLLISNELAKLLSCDRKKGILVQSEYGNGSKFSFEILDQKTPQEDISDSLISPKLTQKIPTTEWHFLQHMVQQKSPTVSIAIPMGESYKKINASKSFKPFSFMTSSLNYQATLRIKNESERNLGYKTSFQTKLIQNLILKWYESTQNNPPILIVDDNEFNIMALQYLMESQGITSDCAMSGVNSIIRVNERLKQNIPYQLIFMDIEMPIMDGFEAASRLYQLDKNITIIACSGHRITQADIEQFKDSNIFFAIEKPVLKSQIKDILLKLCDGLKSESSQLSQFF